MKKFFERLAGRAVRQAWISLAEGGIPVGSALFDTAGNLLSEGRNRSIQEYNPNMTSIIDLIRNCKVKIDPENSILVTTLAPGEENASYIDQINFKTIVVCDDINFSGSMHYLMQRGIEVVTLRYRECISLIKHYREIYPERWEKFISVC